MELKLENLDGWRVGSLKLAGKKSLEKIYELNDQGNSGDWWRITETWEIENAGNLLYLRVKADVAGTSNMLDSVQIMTNAPVPSVSGMASGRRHSENCEQHPQKR